MSTREPHELADCIYPEQGEGCLRATLKERETSFASIFAAEYVIVLDGVDRFVR